MWYPEEPLTYCSGCDLELPTTCYWRGRGFSIDQNGKQTRITVLYSQCPECGQRRSVGLEGPWWYCLFYGWLWTLRYPNSRPPASTQVARRDRKRASGE